VQAAATGSKSPHASCGSTTFICTTTSWAACSCVFAHTSRSTLGCASTQHEWLARQLQQDGISFRKEANAFVQCSAPERLQQLADSLTPTDLEVPIQAWLRELVPFYASGDPNRISDCAYRLFGSQVEYCTNLIFKERTALDRVAERLLDLNRSIGRPDKLTTIFGYRITRAYRGGLKTQIADHHLGNPVIRSEYKG
jgi:hypothetical protein